MRDFQVGFAKRDITPELGTLLCGYPRDRQAAWVRDPLWIRALAIRQDEKVLLFVSADLGTFSAEKADEIREAIFEATGISKEFVIVFTIHTHSGPIIVTTPGWGFANESYFSDIVIPGAVESVKEALVNAKPAVMAMTTTQSHAAVNRREITEDGKVILGQNPDGPYDPTMTVVRFQTPDGAPIGSLVHYGAHATAAGSNFSVTRDWPGIVVDRIEEISGVDCMFMNGAAGDVGPRLSNGETGGDESYVVEMGMIAANDAQKAYEAAVDFAVPELSLFTGDISLPYRKPLTYEEVKAQIEAMGDPDKLVDVQIMKHAQLQLVKRMYEAGESFDEYLHCQQTMVALGDFAIVPGCFEAFSEVALAIRAGSPYAHTIYLGYANGCYGYLPTVEQLPYGGYEVDSFYAVGVTGFQDHTSEVFAEGNIRLLKEMHSL